MNTAALRTLIIYAIILPLAIFIGWTAVDLARWDRTSLAVFAAIIFVLLLPLILKWHYAVMVMSWNTAVTVFFLPGKPMLWMVMAGITFGIAVLHRIIQKRRAFLSAPSITISLLALLAVALMTGTLRGGFGVQALGSASYGGKAYYYIVAGVIGYFAFASHPLPAEQAKTYMGLFYLPGLLAAASSLIYYVPGLYFLYLVLPMGFAGVQAATESAGMVRIAGFTAAAVTICFYLMSIYGLRGILRKPLPLLVLVVSMILGTLGGYRSLIVLCGLLFLFLFLVEGLYRTPIFPVLVLAGVLGFGALAMFATSLPRAMQRSLSFLPIKIDPWVRSDAQASTEWRLEIWRALVPDLPKYIWLGKGYALNPTDLYLSEQAELRGRGSGPEAAIVTGDYHSGPLSTYISLGGPGVLAFVAFLVASFRALLSNHRYGDEKLKIVNRFLLSYFLAQIVFFLGAFGTFSGDLAKFTSIVGLSVALNRGICRKPVPALEKAPRFKGSLALVPAVPAPGAS